MAKEYSWETRENAEELYIINGLTYEQVAEQTSVSVSQLKRWSKESGWRERRKEYRQAQTSIRYNVRMAKAKLIKSVVANQDAQLAYAFNSLVSASAAIEKEAAEQPKIYPKGTSSGAHAVAARIIKTPQDAVEALQEAIQYKINTMLTEPDALSFTAIKDTKQAMEMVEQLAAKYKTATEGANAPGGLSDEGVEEIINQILGTSK